MKIIFKDSKLDKGIIQVSLDGGTEYTEYDIAKVKELGIPLGDLEDFSKVKIKGPASLLQSVDVVSSVKMGDIRSVGIILPGGIAESSDVYKDLVNIDIKNGITSIGSHAFSECSNLTNITLPKSVEEINEYAFFNCLSLTNINIPDSVFYIGSFAFSGCSNLTSITLPRNIRLGASAFECCYSLAEINYRGTEYDWAQIIESEEGSRAFPSCPMGDVTYNFNYPS